MNISERVKAKKKKLKVYTKLAKEGRLAVEIVNESGCIGGFAGFAVTYTLLLDLNPISAVYEGTARCQTYEKMLNSALSFKIESGITFRDILSIKNVTIDSVHRIIQEPAQHGRSWELHLADTGD